MSLVGILAEIGADIKQPCCSSVHSVRPSLSFLICVYTEQDHPALAVSAAILDDLLNHNCHFQGHHPLLILNTLINDMRTWIERIFTFFFNSFAQWH